MQPLPNTKRFQFTAMAIVFAGARTEAVGEQAPKEL